MPIAEVAKRFGLDPKWIEAVQKAEGGEDALVKAVRRSVPTCADYAQALDITARSIVHRLSDYVKERWLVDFVHFLGARWAPVGADNDPHGLNANWVPNVLDALHARNA